MPDLIKKNASEQRTPGGPFGFVVIVKKSFRVDPLETCDKREKPKTYKQPLTRVESEETPKKHFRCSTQSSCLDTPREILHGTKTRGKEMKYQN